MGARPWFGVPRGHTHPVTVKGSIGPWVSGYDVGPPALPNSGPHTDMLPDASVHASCVAQLGGPTPGHPLSSPVSVTPSAHPTADAPLLARQRRRC